MLCKDHDNQLFPELSERQMLILKMIANGLSNSYIASYTGINQRTVEYHVTQIIKKLMYETTLTYKHVLDFDRKSISLRARLAHLFYKRLLDAVKEISRV